MPTSAKNLEKLNTILQEVERLGNEHAKAPYRSLISIQANFA